MENNLAKKADEVLNTPKSVNTDPRPKEIFVRDSILVRPGMSTMPKVPHRAFIKRPIFIILILIVLLIVLSAVFTVLNIGRFKKLGSYEDQPMTDAEYNQLVKKLSNEGFFTTAQIDDMKLKELQKEYESDERFKNPPITDETRQNILENSGTVVQEN